MRSADAAAPPSVSRKERPHAVRYDYLDNIKWTLAIMVILHHAAAIAGLDKFPINFPLVDKSLQYQYGILRTFQSVNQGFFMSLFFFISAYFVAPSYDRKGAKVFLQDKLVRLGIPTLVTILLIDPVALYICGDTPFFESMGKAFQMYGSMLLSGNMVVGVTWFCWALIVFNSAYVFVSKLRPAGAHSSAAPAPIPSTIRILLFGVLMIPCNYLGLYLMDTLGEDFLGFHLLKYFPMYVAMFCFGIQAQKNNWLDQLTFKHAFTWIVVWILAMIFLKPFSGMVSRPFEVMGMSIFLLYGFKTLYGSTNNWTRLLSRSAYAAYLIQIIPLCIFGKLLLPHMTQYPVVNFFLVGLPSVSTAFFAAHFLCKLPLLKRVI